MKKDVTFFNNPFSVVIENHPHEFHLELCDLQADPFLNARAKTKPLKIFT
jgi:hypothetical protein